MGVSPTHLPGYKKAEKASDGDIFKALANGEIKVVIVTGADPVSFAPDTEAVKKALSSAEFLIVTASYNNATADMADMVLPSTTFAEREGSYTNNEGRVQLVRAAVSPVGESKPEWDIFQRVGEALGRKEVFDKASDITAEIGQNVPGYGGVTASGLEWGDKYAEYPQGAGSGLEFDQKSQKISDDSEHPYLALIGNSLYHLGALSRHSKALNEIESKTWVEISPADAEKADIYDGDTITVSSKNGAIEAVARVSDRSPDGVLFLPKNYEDNPALRLVKDNGAVARVKVAKA